ncbi:MAG: AAA family ATPase [Candidatus Woesearchaeota archaeon]
MKNLIPQEKLLVGDPFPSIIGQQAEKAQIKSALLTGRHIILVGPPGVGKTTFAKGISQLLTEDFIVNPFTNEKSEKKIPGEKRFIRVQGSPDLTAEDLIGDIDPIKALKFGPLSIEAFTPGKIFKAHNGILFFDEINRCSEKLQNSLLQVLEEGVVTIGGYTVDVPTDFIFIGTMNPEDTSTEPLSEVFLDRFDLIYAKYPETLENEVTIVRQSGKDLGVKCSEELLTFMVRFVRTLRNHELIQKHPSVRASIGLYERAQGNALIENRSEVVFDDVSNAVHSVLAHRIGLKPSVKFLQKPEDIIAAEFEKFAEKHGMQKEEGDAP